MRLSIAVLSNRDHKPQFTRCLVDLVRNIHERGHLYGIEDYGWHMKRQCSILTNARHNSIDDSIADGSTHLFSIDDDMTFQPDALELLASRNVPFIGVNAVNKNPNERLFTAFDFNNQMIDSRGKKGIEEVKYCGFGMVLLDLRIMATIPPPYFELGWNQKQKRCAPEDYYFCEKLRQNNVKIHIDHDVSQNIGHIGDYVYTMNSYG